jgi:Plant transposon protein
MGLVFTFRVSRNVQQSQYPFRKRSLQKFSGWIVSDAYADIQNFRGDSPVLLLLDGRHLPTLGNIFTVHREQILEQRKQYSKLQEAVRQWVERVFGVLSRRRKILFVHSELWSEEKMNVIATACIVLHNMVV